MKKYVFGLLLALLIVMMAVPAMATLKIDGISIDSTNGPFTGEGWTYDAGENTLTLSDVNIVAGNDHAILATLGEIKEIELIGSNQISNTNWSVISIQNSGELVVSGPGSLTVSGSKGEALFLYNTNLTVQDGAVLNLSSPENASFSPLSLDGSNISVDITGKSTVNITHQAQGKPAIQKAHVYVTDGSTLNITDSTKDGTSPLPYLSVGARSKAIIRNTPFHLHENNDILTISSPDTSACILQQRDFYDDYEYLRFEDGSGNFIVNQIKDYASNLFTIELYDEAYTMNILPGGNIYIPAPAVSASSVPKTGVASPVAAALPLLLGSMCGMLFLRRKQR